MSQQKYQLTAEACLDPEELALPGFIQRDITFWIPLFFEFTSSIIYAYSVCVASHYNINPNRINAGSFFVQYGFFLAKIWGGPYSGAHINFAVSLSLYLRKGSKFTRRELILYFFAQLFGIFLGGMLAWALQDKVNAPTQQQFSGAWLARDFFAQIFSAFVLFFFVVYSNTPQWPLDNKIVTYILLAIMLFITRTFSFKTQCLNPSTALALGLVYSMRYEVWFFWKNIWVLVCGPIIGALLAVTFVNRVWGKWSKTQ